MANTHVFDLKLDGVRAFARWDGAALTLTNRTGVDITHRYPELAAAARESFDLPIWLDGEIVADDGLFETTLTRDKQAHPAAIQMQSVAHPTTFYAFDIPSHHQHPWRARRDALTTELGPNGATRFRLTPFSYEPEYLDRTRTLGLEGVIAKRLTSTYEFGARSKSWIKFKCVRRLTCLVSGYSPGTGARTHFGAMHLALIDSAGQLQDVGRVGTGFTLRQTHELKELLDKGTILVVEIEALNVTSGGALRFPVFKGIRTDKKLLECTTQQLDEFPRC